MRLIFVRHGDPDYVNDSLTEKGFREAELLSKRIRKWKVTDFYTSPLGRAKATAAPTLEKMNRQAAILDWTKEFSYFVDDPITDRHGVPWDFVSSFWTNEPLMFEKENWVNAEVFRQNPEIPKKYTEVCTKLDELLASYGYIREDKFYRMPNKEEVYIKSTIAPGTTTTDNILSSDTSNNICPESQKKEEPVIVIFCHLGAICIMLSHLLNIPFPLLVHGFFLPTSSLTVLCTEERWSNEAYFRVQTMGDTTHLHMAGEPLSSAGYFTEVFQG